MTIVTDTIADYTAELVPVVAAPTGDLGYGSDLSCVDDLTSDMAEVAGASTQAVAEAIYRRLTTPHGSVPDDPDYGLDLLEFLNRGLTRRSLFEIPGFIRGELDKDDRILTDALSVTMATSPDLKSFEVNIRCEDAGAPYSLTLAVTDGVVLLTEIQANAG